MYMYVHVCVHVQYMYKFITDTVQYRNKSPWANLWSVEDILYREHRDDGEYLFTAAEVDTLDEHLAELWGQREFGHPSTEAGQQTFVI